MALLLQTANDLEKIQKSSLAVNAVVDVDFESKVAAAVENN